MAIITSNLEMCVRRILMKETANKKDELNLSLIAVTRRALANLDIEKWQTVIPNDNMSIEEFYYEQLYVPFSDRESIIIFLLFSYKLDSIDDDFLDIVINISEALDSLSINPHNYKNYLDLFTYPNILDILLTLEPRDAYDLIAYLMHSITVDVFTSHNYRAVEKMICTCLKRNYSPYLKEDYSIKNVQRFLQNTMQNPQCFMQFSDKEIHNISLLEELETLSTPTFKTFFKNKIMELESRFEDKEVLFARSICRSIPLFIMEARRDKLSFDRSNDAKAHSFNQT